ncbi:MAG: hypothetical protein JNM94_13500 [Phycisphaerae bacterium]|nr:hypothetical protein [Phycisphaerae bacterium]
MGIARDAPCPECRTLPATRSSFELPEAPGLGLVEGLLFVLTLVFGVAGLAAIARGLTVNSAPLGIGALLVSAIGAYSLVKRLIGVSGDGYAARARWILAPAGVTSVSSDGVVRFRPWSHIGSVAVRPARRGRIVMFLFMSRPEDSARNDSIVVQGTRSLTPSRLGRVALGLRARGQALERAAPPTSTREPPSNELLDAVLHCRVCGRPLLVADAAAGCPLCRRPALAPDDRVVCGASSAHPVLAALGRDYGPALSISAAIMVVGATSLRLELAGLGLSFFVIAVVGAVRRALRRKPSFGDDRAWILRDGGIDILDRAYTRHVFASDVAGVDVDARRTMTVVSLRDHAGEAPIDRIWLQRGPSRESEIDAVRQRVSRWTAATRR